MRKIGVSIVVLSLLLSGCSSQSDMDSLGNVDSGASVVEVGLPPSLSPDAQFELVVDLSIEDFFAQTTGDQVRPVMITYQNDLLMLVLDYAVHSYFPLQGADDLRIAVSTDGRDWAVSNQSIFNISDGQGFTFRPYSMIRVADGTYALYGAAAARTIETIQSWASQTAIIRATAPNPMDSWTVDPEPVLLPGDAYSWDRSIVWSPYVFAESDGFRMYYWGQPGTDFNADNGVGVALSEDGIVWRKTMPDGSQGDASSNLLLSRSQAQWEETILLHVWRTLDGWQLMYYLRDRRDGGYPHLAFSRDGVEWTPIEGDMQLPESTTPDDIIYASLIYAQEHYWLLYCVGIDTTYCYLARTAD